MTLPSVINETRNKQHVVAFKKLYSNFSNAINLFKAEEGCEGIDVASCIESLGYGDNRSLYRSCSKNEICYDG